MVQKDFAAEYEYEKGFNISHIFLDNSVGIATHRDGLVISDSRKNLENRMTKFFDWDKSRILNELPVKESKTWDINNIKTKAVEFQDNSIRKILYRPLDVQYIYHDENFIDRSRRSVMKNFDSLNLGLIIGRQGQAVGSMPWNLAFVTECISDLNVYYRGGGVNFPLYLYPEEAKQNKLLDSDAPVDVIKTALERVPNLDPAIVADIAKAIGLTFTNEKIEKDYDTDNKTTFAPIDILDYIYAILHSPTYRETYKEFLKIDFPRVAYPNDAESFWSLVELGGQLRQVHLLESPKLAEKAKALGVSYPVSGNNEVTRKMTKSSLGFELSEVDASIGKVWVNDDQYFDNIPLVAWEFYIGGYQPAQKWLKDRKDRTLNISDIKHYINIISVLTITDELMQKINEIDVVS